ncbi:MAG: hypothetical protein JWM86_130 [Thermoleophilia bacterium]|nr:hypothetical protein [Thermoleophilia bacterium]
MSRPFVDVMSAIFLPMLPALTAFLVSFAGAWLLGYEQPGQATVREIRGGD